MSWVTWVTWGFVALAIVVLLVTLAASRGLLDVSFGPPYQAPDEPEAPSGHRSGVEWTKPAGGPVITDQAPATESQHHPRTTGEPADGRHEAQDR